MKKTVITAMLFMLLLIPAGHSQGVQFDEEQKKLERYIEKAKEYESLMTNEKAEKIPDERVVCETKGELSLRLAGLADRITDTREHIVYAIGKNILPAGTALKEVYYERVVYSNYRDDEITIGTDVYYISRFGIRKKYDEKNCIHVWKETAERKEGCLQRGVKKYKCGLCGKEKEIFTAPCGHTDEDKDGICDRCRGEAKSGKIHAELWNTGDELSVKMDGREYIFRCIDTDYSDRLENAEKTALFLCEEIIASTYGGGYVYEKLADGHFDYVWHPGPLAFFGESNDYKYSDIRKWLDIQKQPGCFEAQTGISYSFTGETEEGAYQKFDKNNLRQYGIGYQKINTKMFILSLEEALRYGEILWKFGDSNENNPEEINETGTHAYWLRTPAGTAQNYRQTGEVYIVDLDKGNIHPAKVKPEGNENGEAALCNIGVRPAFTMPQSY